MILSSQKPGCNSFTIMENVWKLAAIAIGGASGAVARYLVNVSPLSRVFESFPLATLLINVTGSFLIGLSIILLSDRFVVSEAVRLGLIVGFLGGFTTFSTFEGELYGLLTEGEALSAGFYLLLSVAGGFIGVASGILLARRLI
jgi:CrcB protein